MRKMRRIREMRETNQFKIQNSWRNNPYFCLLPSAFCLLPSAFCLLPLNN
jgi:hypothetical protein